MNQLAKAIGMEAASVLSSIRSGPIQVAVGRVIGFALVSGVGLALDVALFLLLIYSGAWYPYANIFSASAAVAFVYFASAKRVFAYQGRFLFGLFLVYLAYQLLAVATASWALPVIVPALGLAPIVAKLLLLPATFSANYLFMYWLVASRA